MIAVYSTQWSILVIAVYSTQWSILVIYIYTTLSNKQLVTKITLRINRKEGLFINKTILTCMSKFSANKIYTENIIKKNIL